MTDKVHIYPGADEIGCTLFARIFCEVKRFAPSFRLRYSSTNGPFCIPKYEDRTLGESVKSPYYGGGRLHWRFGRSRGRPPVYHSPAVGQTEMGRRRPIPSRAAIARTIPRSTFASSRRRSAVSPRKASKVALADVALCNGGDHSLMKLLSRQGLLASIASYGAWNTSGNSLGTAISHAIVEAYGRINEGGSSVTPEARARSKAYYVYRLLEDWGYQSAVRQELCETELPALDAEYFRLSHVQNKIEAMIGPRLEQFSKTYFPELGEAIIADVRLPWHRMFEVGFRLTLTP